MKRAQIYLDEDLAAELAAAARDEGRSGASIVREALRRYLRNRRGRSEVADPLAPYIGMYEGSPDASVTVDQVLYGGPPGK